MNSTARRAKDLARVASASIFNLIDRPVLVLLYHRVTTLDHDPQLLAVSPENFRSHLDWLKSNYPILRFEDDWRTAPRPAIVITFDDGYADNAREALPIIEEAGVPATFFVSTGTVGTSREFWWDEIERCVESAPEPASPLRLPNGRLFASHIRIGNDWRAELCAALQPALKNMFTDARNDALDALRSWAKVGDTGRSSHRALSLDELRALSASPWVTLGAHTVSHSPLSVLSATEQREEIEFSRRQLETWTGRPNRFSYPFGGSRDYNRQSVALCRGAGLRKVAANIQSSWHRWQGDLEVPRRLVRNWNGDDFAAQIGRFFRR